MAWGNSTSPRIKPLQKPRPGCAAAGADPARAGGGSVLRELAVLKPHASRTHAGHLTLS